MSFVSMRPHIYHHMRINEPLLTAGELGEAGSNPYPVLMSKRMTNKAAMPGGDSMVEGQSIRFEGDCVRRKATRAPFEHSGMRREEMRWVERSGNHGSPDTRSHDAVLLYELLTIYYLLFIISCEDSIQIDQEQYSHNLYRAIHLVNTDLIIIRLEYELRGDLREYHHYFPRSS